VTDDGHVEKGYITTLIEKIESTNETLLQNPILNLKGTILSIPIGIDTKYTIIKTNVNNNVKTKRADFCNEMALINKPITIF